MKFQVTEIEFEFDFNDPDKEFTQDDCNKIADEVVGSFWDADNDEDLVEEITCATGWCIKSIDYVHVLV